MTPRLSAVWAAATVLVVSVASLAACGGVGSGGTGIEVGSGVGTVNGFGSVIVDGQRFDDTKVAAVQETAPGVDTPIEVQLGDRVELQVGAGSVASSLRVDAALIGGVATLSGNGFIVLGQGVTINSDPAKGPVTQFGGGYSGAGSVAVDDAVEVHGLVVAQGTSSTIQATRVVRLAQAPAYLKVTGIVGNLSSDGFSLGALGVATAGASIVPAGQTLSNGRVVAVFALPATLSSNSSGPQVAATQVRVSKLGMSGDAFLSGSVAALDTAGKTFVLGGALIHYDAATFSPAGAALANGQYVRVSGIALGDGSLQANAVTVRNGRDEAEAELRGNILGFVAIDQPFEVRGVMVDASQARIEGCPGGTLAEGLYVEIEGSLTATMVVASQVHCEDEPSGATIEREGVASAVDTVALQFTLTSGTRPPLTVRWTAQTFFRGTTPDTLAGRRVEIEGILDGDTLVATKVALDD